MKTKSGFQVVSIAAAAGLALFCTAAHGSEAEWKVRELIEGWPAVNPSHGEMMLPINAESDVPDLPRFLEPPAERIPLLDEFRLPSPATESDGISKALEKETMLRFWGGTESGRVVMPPPEWLIGVEVRPLDRVLAEYLGLADSVGLIIEKVMEGSAAEKAGLRKGEIILAAGGREVRYWEDLMAESQEAGRHGRMLALRVLPKAEPRVVEVRPQAVAQKQSSSTEIERGMEDREARMRLDTQAREIEELKRRIRLLEMRESGGER